MSLPTANIISGSALWYTSRATGVVCLVLFTVVSVLGIMVNRQGRLPGLPRFAVTGLHRSLSLIVVAFLAVHIVTALADQYVTIQLIAVVVPFTSTYESLWIGLGAVALDLLAAVILTSLIRGRLPAFTWRVIHWSSYAAFPAMVIHSIGSAGDMQSGFFLALVLGCVLVTGLAVSYRFARTLTDVPQWQRAAVLLAGRRHRADYPSRSGRSGRR
jgi:methionine sulfoxide reductase heme-binding subunit